MASPHVRGRTTPSARHATGACDPSSLTRKCGRQGVIRPPCPSRLGHVRPAPCPPTKPAPSRTRRPAYGRSDLGLGQHLEPLLDPLLEVANLGLGGALE